MRASLVASLLALSLACDGDTPEDGLYLRGATIITATGDPPLTGHAVLLRGETIESVELAREDLPPELEVIELDGLTLLPGLIDAHVHVGFTEETRLGGTEALLDYGVTAIRDVGAPLDEILALRDDIAAGRVEGPRIRASGPFFTAPGGHPISTQWAGNEWMIEHAHRVPTDPEVARQEVRLLAEAGVDLIKAVLTTCPWPYRDPCTRLDVEVLEAIVEEAHGLGLPVAVHTDTPEDVEDALGAGADSIEHGVTEGALEPDLVALLATSNVAYVPTMTTSPVYASATMEDLIGRVAMLREAGVWVAVGTDSSGSGAGARWGWSMHRELAYTVDAGYTPMEALVAATRRNAELLGLSDEIGTIEPGKAADLIAVEGNPLEDIRVLEEVRLVLCGGQVVRSEVE